MRDAHRWRPTKFVQRRGRWRASRDPAEVGRGSRLIGDRSARISADLLSRHARGRLLDLGCGKAPLYGMYRDLVDEVTCVDWPASLHDNPHLDHRFDLNEPMPLPDSSYDTIVLTNVLEHIARPDTLWSEMTRVLAPGGRIIVTVPFMYWIHEPPHDHFRYTEFRLRLFCEDNGLEVIELEPTGGSPEVLVDIAAKHLAISRLLSLLFEGFARLILALPPVKKVSAVTGVRFPLGYRLVAGKPR